MRSISEHLAHTAIAFMARDLRDHPETVVLEAKRCLLDSLAVAVGACSAPVSNIICTWAREMGGRQEATVIGDGLMVPAAHAALANGTMLRYWDYNDNYMTKTGAGLHASEIIPAVLAVAEAVRANADSTLKAIILGYELAARLCDAAGKTSHSIGPRGIHHGTLGLLVAPAIVGPLMNLTPQQITNAIGTSGALVMLGIIDPMPHDCNTMAKDVAFPLGNYLGITAASWAKAGFTGPTRVFEGEKGLVASAFGDDYDLEALRRSLVLPWKRYAILETARKLFPVCGPLLGVAEAMHKLVNENNIDPNMVAGINIRASAMCAHHDDDPHGFYAINKETADHSLPFVVSVLLLEKRLGREQFSSQWLKDPRIPRIAAKIRVRADPSMHFKGDPGYVEIRMTNKEVFATGVAARKGHYTNPMSDEDIKAKFRTMSDGFMTEDTLEKCIDLVYRFEEVADISEFMRHFVRS
ncbi:MAG: MmgE/PrpD family protein [candidate division NC10 bacterium]|nr:MmgE/PrpD family protein [candidate division NC10 bacterium]